MARRFVAFFVLVLSSFNEKRGLHDAHRSDWISQLVNQELRCFGYKQVVLEAMGRSGFDVGFILFPGVHVQIWLIFTTFELGRASRLKISLYLEQSLE